MSFLENPRGFSAEEFAAYCAGLKFGAWKPKFVTLHNTAEPSLRQWRGGGAGASYEHQRICNLNHYYRTLGWHSGPHIFISPDFIWLACDLVQDGVHASCFNHVSVGVEMVGDYAIEAFDSGDGAKVRDLAVAALAALDAAMGVGADSLKFHRECERDHHDCPGRNVDKADMVQRVATAMRKRPAPVAARPASAPAAAARPAPKPVAKPVVRAVVKAAGKWRKV